MFTVKKSLIRSIVLGILLLFIVYQANSQEAPPEDITEDYELDGVPLDGGVISLIIAAGVGYFFHKNKKKTGLNE